MSIALKGCMAVASYLIQNGRYHIIEDHALVSSRGEDLVKLVCLIAQRTRTHAQFDFLPPHAIGGDDDTAVLADFAVVPAPGTDDDVDVGLLILLLSRRLALRGPRFVGGY